MNVRSINDYFAPYHDEMAVYIPTMIIGILCLYDIQFREYLFSKELFSVFHILSAVGLLLAVYFFVKRLFIGSHRPFDKRVMLSYIVSFQIYVSVVGLIEIRNQHYEGMLYVLLSAPCIISLYSAIIVVFISAGELFISEFSGDDDLPDLSRELMPTAQVPGMGIGAVALMLFGLSAVFVFLLHMPWQLTIGMSVIAGSIAHQLLYRVII